jgi:tetratricopeptide (TPR) repeat protein
MGKISMNGAFLVMSFLAGVMGSSCSSLPNGSDPVTERFEAASQIFTLGESQFNQGLYGAARGSFESSLYQYGVLDEREGVIRSLLAMGQSSVALGDYSQAQKSYLWALSMAEDMNDPLFIRDTANHLGNYYLAMNDSEEAEKWALYGSLPDGRGETMAEYYRLVGTVAKRKGAYEESLELYRKALDIDSGLFESVHVGTNYYLIGSAYSLMGEYKKAESSLLQALEKDRYYEFLPGIAADLLALGLVLEKDGRADEALIFFDRAYLAWKGQGNEEKAEELSQKISKRGEGYLNFP